MRILMICRQNACRSQMAAGIARRYAAEDGLDIEVESAGSEPAEGVNPQAVATMAEIGIDISAEMPKMLTPEMAARADIVVAVCGEDACPYIAGAEYWGIEDPAGGSDERFAEIREIVAERVRDLFGRLSGGRLTRPSEDPARRPAGSQ